jgi:hypothetical protein
MTMKTISNTSITSTMGVTLMFELTLAPSLRTTIPIFFAPWVELLLAFSPRVPAACWTIGHTQGEPASPYTNCENAPASPHSKITFSDSLPGRDPVPEGCGRKGTLFKEDSQLPWPQKIARSGFP